ncbi:hypothetical protein JCM6882_009036 [Rhodosporidiobolus microsporus]
MASTSAAPAPNTDDILSSHRFTAAGASSSSPYSAAPTADSVLSGLSTADPTSLHPLAGLVDNKDLDYLLLEDDKLSQVAGGKTVLPSRGWGDELCYGTGSTYLAGLALGGAWGFTEGLRKPLAPRSAPSVPIGSINPAAAGAAATAGASAPAGSAASAVNLAKEAVAGAKETVAEGAAAAAAKSGADKVSFRLRWNNILNQVTRRGTHMGNSAGVLALIYNGINSTIDVYRGHQHDVYGSMFAAAATGAIWRSTAGVKSMVVTSGLLTAGAAGWSWVKVQFL